MYFDKYEKRLRYSDGTQWIQVDPAYTSKEIKCAIGVGSSKNTLPTTLDVLDPQAVDIIITGMSVVTAIDSSVTLKIELLVGGTVKATFHKVHVPQHVYQGYKVITLVTQQTSSKDFPVPIKVPQGNDIKIRVDKIDPGGIDYSVEVRGPCIEYIEFPF